MGDETPSGQRGVTVGLLERIEARTVNRQLESRYSADQYLTEYLMPATINYGGIGYTTGLAGLTQTLAGNRATEVASTLPGYLAALRACPPAFAAQLVRALVLSQARFVFRNPPWHPSSPRKTFGTRALGLLERPWPNGTTGELIARMEWHAGLAGNAYVVRRPDRLRTLRPDWVAILYGSDLEPDDPGHALDGELLGYIYANQGLTGGHKPHTLLPQDVSHWSPLPDPENAGIGMSWITPAIREIQKDRLATTHTIKYFEQGATPNLVVKGIPAVSREQFDEIVSTMEASHAGVANAYRTLYLTAGADATVVGANLADLDLKAINGASETRIASLSRVHPVILGIAEGLAGSSLNAGNFGMARRIWADSWIYPTLQDLAASLAPLVDVPNDAELWTDVGDMPILREDAKDAAEIEQIRIATIGSAIQAGFTPESSVAAVRGQDVNLLKHTGMVSVQLQKPGETPGQPQAIEPPAMRSMPDEPCCDWDPDEPDPDPSYQGEPYDEVDLADEAHGRAVTPAGIKGGLQLKAYWTKGKGLAKWAGSPHPWTALYRHIVEHVKNPAKAKRIAAAWFHAVFGIWPGHRKGKNPVGPG